MARINEAVERILVMKMRAGLFNRGLPSEFADDFSDQIGHADHRAIAREAVRKSQVLLKNQGAFSRISRREVHHCWSRRRQYWTAEWWLDGELAGTGNTNQDFPGGTSIAAGLTAQIEAAGGSVTSDTDADADVAIVVFGESPYAEMQGDVYSLPGTTSAVKGL